MQFDDDLKQFMDKYMQSQGADYSLISPAEARQNYNQAFSKRPTPTNIELHKIEDKIINGVAGDLKLRIYHPTHHQNLPALIYFHGGGFVFRDHMNLYDQTCRLIAKHTNCVVISVDYRLAPENRFPAAPEDCYYATLWVKRHAQELSIDANRIGVIGESCGGNLAAVIPLMAKQRGDINLLCQIIVSPMLDLNFATQSYQQYAEGFILTKAKMQWFWDQYLSQEADQQNPFAVPLKAKDLQGLPPALVITTEYDVLKDEGAQYAKLLQSSGNKVEYHCYEGLIHGFFDLYDHVNRATIACDDILAKAKVLMQK